MQHHTYEDAVRRFQRELTGRTADQTLDRLHKLTPWLGQQPLESISNARISEAIDQYAAAFLNNNPRRHKQARPLSATTRNHYRIAVRTLMNSAWRNWEWLDAPPRIRLEQTEERHEARWLTPDEAERLLAACTGRRLHWKAPLAFALATGLRAGNVFDLQWKWINVDRRTLVIPAMHYKSKRPHRVPLNRDAMAILAARRGLDERYVFTYRGEPIKRIHPRNFKQFCDELGLHGVTFHTTRHTFAAWHLMNGTSVYDLAKLGGWSSVKMVEQTYGHLADDYLHAMAENIAFTAEVQKPEATALSGTMGNAQEQRNE